jgi:hypothetical protein
MEGLKAPYVVHSNHMAFEDLELNAMANYPYRVSNIATFETFHKRAWLLERCGCVGKRKFTTDPSLLRACETILNEYKSVLTIYPEARYSPWGTTSYIPPSYASLVKRLGKPVCIMVHHGNYLSSPFWDWRRHRKIKHYSTLKKVLDEKQLEELSLVENIVGIKEASDSADRLTELSKFGDELYLYAGNDSQIFATMTLGGMGVISVVSNIFPEQIKKICDACLIGDLGTAKAEQLRLFNFIRLMFKESNPAPIKYAMSIFGLCSPELRLPLCKPELATRKEIMAELIRLKG